jgi:hypothetical protein
MHCCKQPPASRAMPTRVQSSRVRSTKYAQPTVLLLLHAGALQQKLLPHLHELAQVFEFHNSKHKFVTQAQSSQCTLPHTHQHTADQICKRAAPNRWLRSITSTSQLLQSPQLLTPCTAPRCCTCRPCPPACRQHQPAYSPSTC